MKTKLISTIAITVVCFGLTYIGLAAETKEYSDTVVLKNGTVLNNVKTEDTITITTADGKKTVYNKSEVKVEESVEVTDSNDKKTTYSKDEISEVKKGSGSTVAKRTESAPPDDWSANEGYMNWADAKEKCASLGMKLPTIDDLKAAQEAKKTDSWKKQGYLYWSSTQDSTGNPFLLYAYTGEVYSLSQYGNSYVRCMR